MSATKLPSTFNEGFPAFLDELKKRMNQDEFIGNLKDSKSRTVVWALVLLVESTISNALL